MQRTLLAGWAIFAALVLTACGGSDSESGGGGGTQTLFTVTGAGATVARDGAITLHGIPSRDDVHRQARAQSRPHHAGHAGQKLVRRLRGRPSQRHDRGRRERRPRRSRGRRRDRVGEAARRIDPGLRDVAAQREARARAVRGPRHLHRRLPQLLPALRPDDAPEGHERRRRPLFRIRNRRRCRDGARLRHPALRLESGRQQRFQLGRGGVPRRKPAPKKRSRATPRNTGPPCGSSAAAGNRITKACTSSPGTTAITSG